MHVLLFDSIGTFAVQNISVTSVAPGELQVTGDFITNTSAVGMLAIVYSTDNDSDIHYTEARLPQTEIHLTGLSENTYSISVFDMQHHGLPFNQAATLPTSANISQGTYMTLYALTSPASLGMFLIINYNGRVQSPFCVNAKHSIYRNQISSNYWLPYIAAACTLYCHCTMCMQQQYLPRMHAQGVK